MKQLHIILFSIILLLLLIINTYQSSFPIKIESNKSYDTYGLYDNLGQLLTGQKPIETVKLYKKKGKYLLGYRNGQFNKSYLKNRFSSWKESIRIDHNNFKTFIITRQRIL